MNGATFLASIPAAAESTETTLLDPGLGATVPSPPPIVLILGLVVGIVALAFLWAASRR